VIITCPNCAFSRDVPPEKMPAHSVIATCPRCSCRFRFSPADDALDAPPHESGGTDGTEEGRYNPDGADHPAQDEDDPLPPGTVRLGQSAPPPENAAEQDNADEQEDMRLTAARAYSREAARFEEDERTPDAGNPWDMAPAEKGWAAAFYQTVLRVMLDAQRFFSSLVPQTRPLRALYFYLIVSVFQIVVERFWGYMLLQYISGGNPSPDPQLDRLLTMLAPQTSLAMTVLFKTGLLVLELYFFAALIHLTYRFLIPDRADFSLVFQVMAYSSAPSLLCVAPLIGSLVGFVWSLSCIIIGCRSALKLTWTQTMTGIAPACFAVLLLLAQFMKAAQG
jgi:hypothetical protein